MNKDFNFFNKFSFSILVILIMGILSKNLIRIHKNFNNIYVDYPWPKMNHIQKIMIKIKISKYMQIMESFYITNLSYTLCMYSTSPCTSNNEVKYKT